MAGTISIRNEWRRVPAGFAAVAMLVAVTNLAAHAQEREKPPSSCGVTTSAEHRVEHVHDGRTLTLTDGRTILLAGLLIPSQGAANAKAALESLVSSYPVAIAASAEPDRYGRLPALVSMVRDRVSEMAQTAMLAQGWAVQAPAPSGCTTQWREAERTAREGKLGLWADPYYLVKDVGDFTTLAAERGRFAIAEGRVVSVRESGGMIYLNFGRRWTESLSVGVPKRREPAFSSAGLTLKQLQGRRLRVRGWVELRAGPWMEASRPEQIEVVLER